MDSVVTASIAGFLRSIGLEVRAGAIDGRTFVPGVQVAHGAIVFDEGQRLYPGDLLHEAGHLAVVPPGRRSLLNVDVGKDPAEEMMAIAWSYAAAVQLGLEPTVVFHEHGYRAGGASLAENFSAGRYVGVPMLQWLGLTADGDRAAELGVPPYPHMLKWLLDSDPDPIAA